MKLLVFSESPSFRKQIEDLLTSTPHHFESTRLEEMLAGGRSTGFDGLLVDLNSWQRCVSLLKYYERLDAINQRPVMIFSKQRKLPALKRRNPKALTVNCPMPIQNEDFYGALQQMSSALVAA
jgi:hypothetical protein